MASDTRIQHKSRRAKKVIGTADFSLGGQSVTWTGGKKPRADKRGYTQDPVGVPFPVLVAVTAVA